MAPGRRTEGRSILAERRAIRRKSSSKTTKSKRRRTTKRSRKPVKRERPALSSTLPTTTKQELKADAISLQPKVEYSPNALAKCHVCRKKIRKEHKRYGIPEHSERYNKEIFRYYHFSCCPDSLKALVPTAVADLKHQRDQAEARQQILALRKELFQTLQELRRAFAVRLDVSPFIVVSNHTLEEIVYHMPTTREELLNVRGIGPVKLQSFGDPILRVVQQYERTLITSRSSRTQTTTTHRHGKEPKELKKCRRIMLQQKARATAGVIVIDDSDDEGKDSKDNNHTSKDGEDYEIDIGQTLTCEELVNQKFQHAAANGYVISVD